MRNMRAVRLRAYGPPEQLSVEEVPEPRLERPTDVRVAVRAAGVNPIDWKIRAGGQRGAIRLKLPWTLGLDVSGVVTEVGPGVRRFSVGDEVYGCPDHRRPGSYAEQCVVAEANLAKKPRTVSHVEAASLPLVGLTAWQCLLPRLARRPGQRVLVQAGSGGVGTFAIQLAKHHGAWVATTCSKRNHALVRSVGADLAIDYHEQRWEEAAGDVDVVLEAVGERERALRHVGRGARVASIVSGLPERTERYGPNLGLVVTALGVAGFWLRGRLRGVDAVTVVKRNDPGQLEAIAGLVEAGAIRPVVDRVYPLAEAAEAHRYGQTGRSRGKIVLET